MMNLQPTLAAAPTTLPATTGRPMAALQAQGQQMQGQMPQPPRPPPQQMQAQGPTGGMNPGTGLPWGQHPPGPSRDAQMQWQQAQMQGAPQALPQMQAVPGNPAIMNPYKPGPFPGGQRGPARGRPARPGPSPEMRARPFPARPAPGRGVGRQLNWQQQQMQQMPPGMRQMYNGRPMTRAATPMQPSMDYSPSMTRRGQPVASRVNLQRNQFPRAGNNSNYNSRR